MAIRLSPFPGGKSSLGDLQSTSTGTGSIKLSDFPVAKRNPTVVELGAEQEPIKVSVGDVVKEVPTATKKVVGGLINTFVPSIKNFFVKTGSIFGEGLAYAIDPLVREQYKAGNLNILPTITKETPVSVAKSTIAAGIEVAIYRSFPNIVKLNLAARGGAGALQGLGFAVAEGLATDKSPEDIVKSLPAYGVFGGIVGAITPYLMPLLKAEVKALPKEIKSVFKGLQKEIGEIIPKKPGVVTPEALVPETTPKPITLETAPAPEPTIPTGKEPAGLLETPKAPELLPERAPIISGGERITRVPREQLPVGEGETAVSRLEARIKGKLDEVPLKKADDAGITTYQQMNKTEQISKAVEYVQKSPEEAISVLKGEKPAPAGLLHNSIAIALEEKAATTADANLAIKLASLRSTRAGQEISILTEADPTNPISAINEIIKARAGKALRQVKDVAKETTRVTSEAKQVLKVSELKVFEAEKILAEITC
ncbi:MAG: hypothetical protein NUV80_00950 [Candidatus Berkelbacteria bacterium]|nr:hypothetical protein [Candidatus Berkelbacteria bacterium]